MIIYLFIYIYFVAHTSVTVELLLLLDWCAREGDEGTSKNIQRRFGGVSYVRVCLSVVFHILFSYFKLFFFVFFLVLYTYSSFFYSILFTFFPFSCLSFPFCFNVSIVVCVFYFYFVLRIFFFYFHYVIILDFIFLTAFFGSVICSLPSTLLLTHTTNGILLLSLMSRAGYRCTLLFMILLHPFLEAPFVYFCDIKRDFLTGMI